MLQKNINITPFTTFGVEVHAKLFSIFNSVEDLKNILSQVHSQPLLILGGGSNILFTKNFDGVVLLNKIKGIELIEEDEESVVLKVGAGEVWHDFVLYAVENGWGGIENLSLIPGSVGASPMQNIGAYGVEIKDVFESLEALEIATGNVQKFNHKECKFGYRESIFKNKLKGKHVIISVNYRLFKNPKLNTHYGAIEHELESRNIISPTIRDVSDAVISIRKSKLPDPKKIGNGGSFFKNPIISKSQYQKIKETYPNIPFYRINEEKVKVPAGWLIEHAGWKGKTFGNYGVHKNQALVLVNYGQAKGEEIYTLSEQIIKSIESQYGILLEREVNIF